MAARQQYQRKQEDEDEDDGFGDFLDEDEEAHALPMQEMNALARKMKTVGIREGIEAGKEGTLQQGFDDGFRIGAREAYRFGLLRGALSAAHSSGLFQREASVDEQRAVEVCIEQLTRRSLALPLTANSSPSTHGIVDDDQLIATAQQWLNRVGIDVTSAMNRVT